CTHAWLTPSSAASRRRESRRGDPRRRCLRTAWYARSICDDVLRMRPLIVANGVQIPDLDIQTPRTGCPVYRGRCEMQAAVEESSLFDVRIPDRGRGAGVDLLPSPTPAQVRRRFCPRRKRKGEPGL